MRLSPREIDRELTRLMTDADPDAPPAVALERPDGRLVDGDGDPLAENADVRITVPRRVTDTWEDWP